MIDQLLSTYRALDVIRADVRERTVAAISPHLAQVRVEWALVHRSGRLLYEFVALYTLACEGGTCRIVAIAHDEIARAQQGGYIG